jgi:PAS domain S-box-containing protein
MFQPDSKHLRGLFDDSALGLRRLAIALYCVVLPPFALVLTLQLEPGERVLPVASVAALCLAGLTWLLVHRAPHPRDYVFPAAIVPTLCCGIGAATTHSNAFAYLAVMGAPLAWAAVLFDEAVVLTALFTGAGCVFLTQWQRAGLGAGIANALLYLVVQGLVGWVVYGKSRRHREARLESLARQVNDIELVLTLEGTIVEANDRAVEAYGYPRSELLGMNVRTLRDVEARADVGVQMAQALENRDGHTFETVHRHRDGSSFPVEVSSRPFSVGPRRFLHSLVRDISVRHQFEAERRQHLEAAQEATHQREQMLAVVAHDLRNPLTAISFTAEDLEAPPPGELKEMATLILSASSRMRRLIEDLLDFSAMQAGRLRLAPELHDPRTLACEAVQTLSALGLQRGVSLDVQLHDGPALRCDRERLLLGNLLSNAVHITPRGGHVTLSLAQGDDEVCFAVRDTGPGLPPDKLKNLFKAFERGANVPYRGTGLGLTIARGIAEGHGGRLWAENPPGGGACFYVAIPRTRVVQEDSVELQRPAA